MQKLMLMAYSVVMAIRIIGMSKFDVKHGLPQDQLLT